MNIIRRDRLEPEFKFREDQDVGDRYAEEHSRLFRRHRQDGGVRPEQRISNVYKLYRGSRVSPAPVRFVQKLLASVIGRGITTNIADGYEFIINHYQPGDRIFLIGFSRGAYTVCRIA